MKRLIAVLVFLLIPAAAFAQTTVFVVRHAERADAGMKTGPTSDPDLSEAGRARAESLASLLKDAGIARIYVTEFKRTGQTADPLARQLKIEPVVVSSKKEEVSRLIDQVKAGSGNVLIVGHSNTVPEILKGFGIDEAVVIAEMEFDNLFVVNRGCASPSVIRLRYR
jgi:phosphohistidine phosphatase SixA